MFCRYCGKPISDNAKFCPNCGGEIQEQIPVQTVIVPATKKEPSAAARALIAIVAFAVFAAFWGIFIPFIGARKNDKEAFNHAWTYNLNETEMIFDFPHDTMTFEFNGASLDFEMDWTLKGRVLTISIEDDEPETYKVSFSNHRRTMRLTNTEDEWNTMTLWRVD